MYFPLFQLRGWDFRSGMPPKTIDSEIPKQKRTGKPSSLSVQYVRQRGKILPISFNKSRRSFLRCGKPGDKR